MTKLIFNYFFLFIFISGVNAQQQISGRVIDAYERPLEGAYIHSAIDTVVSGGDGSFELLISNGIGVLQVQHIGYLNATFTVNNLNQIDLKLQTSTLDLNEVVVLGNKKVKDQSSSVEVLTTPALKRGDAFQVAESMNRIPGIYMHSGTNTTNRITIRGIGSRSPFGTTKLKAYYNDIPITDGSGNSVIEDIDQSLIGRMEIIKGPNSSLYGNGLGGAINIYSPSVANNESSIASSVDVGAFGTLRIANRLEHNEDKLSLSVTQSEFRRKGFRDNNETERSQIGIDLAYRINPNHSLRFTGIGTQLKAEIPSAINKTDFDNNPRKAAFTWNQSQGYEDYSKLLIGTTYYGSFSNRWSIVSSIFMNSRDGYEARPFNILDDQLLGYGSRTTIAKKWQSVSLSFGTEILQDEYKWATYDNQYSATSDGSLQGEKLTENKEIRNYMNVFAEGTIAVGKKHKLSFGANLNNTNYELTDGFADSIEIAGEYGFDPIISPKIGWIYNAADKHTLFANISHGFSPPSLEETLTPDGLVNTEIQPETGWNYEVGSRGSIKGLNYNLTVYYMDIKNLLVAERVQDDIFIGVNAGENNHFGTELSVNYPLTISNKMTLNWFGALNYMDFHFSSFENRGEVYDGNELTGIPQWSGNTGLELLYESGFYGNIAGQYVGEIPINDANTVYSNSYFLLNAKGGYSFSRNRFQFDFCLGINNLLDTKYASMLLINATGFNGAEPRYYYPGNPRNLFGGVSLIFQLNKKK